MLLVIKSDEFTYPNLQFAAKWRYPTAIIGCKWAVSYFYPGADCRGSKKGIFVFVFSSSKIKNLVLISMAEIL